MSGGHSEVVPRLPIPNRTVKRLSADDSAGSRVKVGHRQTPLRQSPAQTSWALCIGAANTATMPCRRVRYPQRPSMFPLRPTCTPSGQRRSRRPPKKAQEHPRHVDPAANVGRHIQPLRLNRHLPTNLGHSLHNLGHLVPHPMPACGRPPDAPAAYAGLHWVASLPRCPVAFLVIPAITGYRPCR